jgi:hypothetical protein
VSEYSRYELYVKCKMEGVPTNAGNQPFSDDIKERYMIKIFKENQELKRENKLLKTELWKLKNPSKRNNA